MFLEGEEEVSSPNLRPFLESHLDLLRADVCVISDSSMRTIDEPAILHSLRGMTYIEVGVQGPAADLHSGFWGGAVHNPALVLAEILSQLHNHRVAEAAHHLTGAEYSNAGAVSTCARNDAGGSDPEGGDEGAAAQARGLRFAVAVVVLATAPPGAKRERPSSAPSGASRPCRPWWAWRGARSWPVDVPPSPAARAAGASAGAPSRPGRRPS